MKSLFDTNTYTMSDYHIFGLIYEDRLSPNDAVQTFNIWVYVNEILNLFREHKSSSFSYSIVTL